MKRKDAKINFLINGDDTARYPLKSGRYSSHNLILKKIRHRGGKSILDLGCGNGMLAAELNNPGREILGLELDIVDATEARARGINVICGNVEEAVQLTLGRKFDVVIAADILEHLANPKNLLRNFRNLLSQPSGYAVISIPNVANITVRIQLLFGKFNYTSRGILDNTHLRFFTKESLTKLLLESELEIIEYEFSSMPIEMITEGRIPSSLSSLLQYILRFATRAFPTVLGYQSIVLVRAK